MLVENLLILRPSSFPMSIFKVHKKNPGMILKGNEDNIIPKNLIQTELETLNLTAKCFQSVQILSFRAYNAQFAAALNSP